MNLDIRRQKEKMTKYYCEDCKMIFVSYGKNKCFSCDSKNVKELEKE